LIIFLTLVFSKNIVAQDFVKIHGQVLSQDSVPLPYMNIIILNRYKGTLSDNRGYYSLVCLENDTLIFSGMGYKTRYFIIPETNRTDVRKDIYLEKDTILLKEVTVFPWKTYREFKQAVLTVHPPETDKERAEKNIMLSFLQMLYEDEVLDIPNPAAAFRNYFNNEIVQPMYYRGQIRPLTIFNPFAWAELIKAIKRGDFKRKENKVYEYFDEQP